MTKTQVHQSQNILKQIRSLSMFSYSLYYQFLFYISPFTLLLHFKGEVLRLEVDSWQLMTATASDTHWMLAERLKNGIWYFESWFSTLFKIYDVLFSLILQEQLQIPKPQSTFYQCLMKEIIKGGHQMDPQGFSLKRNWPGGTGNTVTARAALQDSTAGRSILKCAHCKWRNNPVHSRKFPKKSFTLKISLFEFIPCAWVIVFHI